MSMDRAKGPDKQFVHTPVMKEEVADLLGVSDRPDAIYLDGTVGTGGHAAEILSHLSPQGALIGMDIDRDSLEFAQQRLNKYNPTVRLYHLNYARIDELLAEENLATIWGILFDFGVSSPQLDNPERGFSFSKDGPLDMRMDPSQDLKAADIVNHWDAEEIEDILYEYGEERWAKRIVDHIVDYRSDEQIDRTDQLADLVTSAIPAKYRYGMSHHPATKTFQALRIAVNDELSNIRQGLKTGFESLAPGGRLVAIAYHSLEDRIVKHFFRHKELSCICPPEIPVCRCDKQQEVELLTDGPLQPSQSEIQQNPRARSAKLRAAQKI